MGEYCLVCKEMVDKRYKITIEDTLIKNVIKGYICHDCFNRFLMSYYNKRAFKISRFFAWIKKKDRLRF